MNPLRGFRRENVEAKHHIRSMKLELRPYGAGKQHFRPDLIQFSLWVSRLHSLVFRRITCSLTTISAIEFRKGFWNKWQTTTTKSVMRPEVMRRCLFGEFSKSHLALSNLNDRQPYRHAKVMRRVVDFRVGVAPVFRCSSENQSANQTGNSSWLTEDSHQRFSSASAFKELMLNKKSSFWWRSVVFILFRHNIIQRNTYLIKQEYVVMKQTGHHWKSSKGKFLIYYESFDSRSRQCSDSSMISAAS